MDKNRFLNVYMKLREKNRFLEASLFALRNIMKSDELSSDFLPLLSYGGFGQSYHPIEKKFVLIFNSEKEIVPEFTLEIYQKTNEIIWDNDFSNITHIYDFLSYRKYEMLIYGKKFQNDMTLMRPDVIEFSEEMMRKIN